MKIKHVYIHSEEVEIKEFIDFRKKDIEKYKIKPRDIFADITIENAIKEDIVEGLCDWDAVRIIHPRKGELLFLEINGKIKTYKNFKM